MQRKLRTHKLASGLDEGEIFELEFLGILVPDCLTAHEARYTMFAHLHVLHKGMDSAASRAESETRRQG